ncbi:hypothetical protein DASC09_012150 [Saccharomycopsis crataegensis]|uniref:ASX DEUBAD domain-containing protein n=1 Tax=Saccharomycopsis crataegensis TaxID=43959 RepID=A0AAV5QHN7_9ASCO|nr:hypothetical protein DASC09_012150 [Saccharomycopsis crataegensis]
MSNGNYDDILREIPLIISPFYNPPRLVKLPPTYKSLPSQLPAPLYYSNYHNNGTSDIEELKKHSTTNDIQSWKDELLRTKENIQQFHKDDKEKYQSWLDENIKHYAPGYLDTNGGILQPKHTKSKNPGTNSDSVSTSSSSLNQLSDIFQSTPSS